MSAWSLDCISFCWCPLLRGEAKQPSQKVPYCYSCSVIQVALTFVLIYLSLVVTGRAPLHVYQQSERQKEKRHEKQESVPLIRSCIHLLSCRLCSPC